MLLNTAAFFETVYSILVKMLCNGLIKTERVVITFDCLSQLQIGHILPFSSRLFMTQTRLLMLGSLRSGLRGSFGCLTSSFTIFLLTILHVPFYFEQGRHCKDKMKSTPRQEQIGT